MLSMSPGSGVVLLALLGSAAAQAPVLPEPRFEFNISLPLAMIAGESRGWTVAYDGTGAEAAPGSLASGPATLRWNSTYSRATAEDRYMSPNNLLMDGLTRNAWVYAELDENPAEPNNVSFYYTDTTPVENHVAPVPAHGLVGKAEGLPWFRRSKADGGFHGLWCVFDNDWTKRSPPNITEVIVTTAIDSKVKSLSQLNVTVWPFVENGNLSSRFTWGHLNPESRSTWNTTSTYAGAVGNAALLAIASEMEGAVGCESGDSRVDVAVPANTSWIALNATRGPGLRTLQFFGTPLDGHMVYSPDTEQRYYVANEMVWYRSLNPRQMYNITITNTIGPAALTALTFYADPAHLLAADAAAGPTAGAIAGGVVGGVVGLALLGLGVWWALRRRRRRRWQAALDEEPGMFEVDGPVTPFEPPLGPTAPLRKHVGDPAQGGVARAGGAGGAGGESPQTSSGSRTPPSLKLQTLQALEAHTPTTPGGYGYPSFMLGTPVAQQTHAALLPTPVTPRGAGGSATLLCIPESAPGGAPSPTGARPRAIDVGAVDAGSDADADEIDPPAYNPEWTRPRTRPQRPRIVVPQSKSPSGTLALHTAQ